MRHGYAPLRAWIEKLMVAATNAGDDKRPSLKSRQHIFRSEYGQAGDVLASVAFVGEQISEAKPWRGDSRLEITLAGTLKRAGLAASLSKCIRLIKVHTADVDPQYEIRSDRTDSATRFQSR
jgi:hypothetical protein